MRGILRVPPWACRAKGLPRVGVRLGQAAPKLARMNLQIVVYSKSACPQCDSAKMLLKSRSLDYQEIKIDDEAERLAFFEKCGPSVRQMPQIFINDQRVGGLAGLQAALAQLAPSAR
jgi:glutaredoxin 3